MTYVGRAKKKGTAGSISLKSVECCMDKRNTGTLGESGGSFREMEGGTGRGTQEQERLRLPGEAGQGNAEQHDDTGPADG